MAMRAPLHVIEGGRKPDRRIAADELHMELSVYFDEVADTAVRLTECTTRRAIENESLRLAFLTEAVRREWLALRPDGAA